MPVLNPQALIENRVAAIRDYHETAGVTRAELDVSGGVDSAVMLGLLAKALGPENVTAVYQGIHSSVASLERARLVAKAFGVPLVEIDLSAMFEALSSQMFNALVAAGYDRDDLDERLGLDPTVYGSIRSCLRAPIGRGFNRMTGGGIRHGTGNEDEDRFVRFYQKGGDGEVDTNPIEMLSKGEVYQLAIALGVPHEIITAKPTPDLWGVGDDHTDEAEYAWYLGIKGYPYYSYVNPDTGEYTTVGLIERMSRFLDSAYWSAWPEPEVYVQTDIGAVLFKDQYPNPTAVESRIFGLAAEFHGFAGIDPNAVKALILASKRVERITRHKYNPNIPMLGDRKSLVEAHILTNDLPVTEKE